MSTPTVASSSPRTGAREAWAGDPPQPSAARERLIEAAARCIKRDGVPQTSIASVAAEAGVSRPTVYRYFADRRELVRDTMSRAALALADRTREHIRAFVTPQEQIVEAVIFVLRETHEDELLGSVWNNSLLDTSALANSVDADAIAIGHRAVGDLCERAGWNAAEGDEAIAWTLRVLISLLVVPAHDQTEPDLRTLLERRLLPSLGLSRKE